MTMILSGDAGVTFPAGGVGNPASAVVGLTDTQTLTNKSVVATQLTGTVAVARLPAGAVLQVVSNTKTDTFSTSSTSFVDVTGLSVSITPTSATSKIFISFMFNGGVDTGAQGINMILVRNSTAICVGDAAGSRGQHTTAIGVGSTYSVEAFSGSFLDSPSTTSATTYKIQMQASGGVAAYVNRSVTDRNTSLYDPRTASTITVMEIAA